MGIRTYYFFITNEEWMVVNSDVVNYSNLLDDLEWSWLLFIWGLEDLVLNYFKV